LKVQINGLRGKYAELVDVHKEKTKKMEEQGEAIFKIESNRKMIAEENERLKVKIVALEKDVEGKCLDYVLRDV
jgi:hypothetical protein